MKDARERVIYIGKAINLRSRVRSYFREGGDQRFSIQFLRGKVEDVEVVVTDTEKEALLLENLLIKKHQPRYNIRLRDDKTYISLRLDTEHEWPRLHRVRKRRAGDKALYFGPFSSSRAVKETMRFLQKLFPLRSCPDHVLRNRARPCILYQIERCCAPCVGKVDRERYQDFVDQTALFLKGRREEVIQLLKERMWEYSESLSYEKAAEVRDKIAAIEKTVEKEAVASHREFDRDVIGVARDRGRIAFVVLGFRGGNLTETSTFDFRDYGQDDNEVLESFLSQYYTAGREVPREIVVPGEPSEAVLLREALHEQRGATVTLLVPQRGEKKRLVEMAAKNAALDLEKRLAGEKTRREILASLQRKLKLPEPPRRIECFDISTFQGSFNVGSMTCFVEGEPEKSLYRHFKVRGVEGQNDFDSMREVLARRYTRVLKEKTPLPDLIVIDGGKGQLNIAAEVLKELGLYGDVPVCGLAKARWKQGQAERTEERVFLPGRKNPIRFDQSDPALFILTRIRDEAHRFGVAYHRKLRSSANLRTGLEEIPGVGAKRRRALLTHFGSLARLRKATSEQIAAVPGIPGPLALEIYDFLHMPVPGPGGQMELELEEKEEAADDLYSETDEEEGEDEGEA